MVDDPPPLIVPSPSGAAERSLVDDVKQLAHDGRTLLEAELAYQKSRAAVAGQGAKGIAGWGGLALALVFFALMALVMGVLLALSATLGAWAATAVVVAALVLTAALAGWSAAQRWKNLTNQLNAKDPPQ